MSNSHLDRARDYATQAEHQRSGGTSSYEATRNTALVSIAHSLAYIAQLMEVQRTAPKPGEFVRR